MIHGAKEIVECVLSGLNPGEGHQYITLPVTLWKSGASNKKWQRTHNKLDLCRTNEI